MTANLIGVWISRDKREERYIYIVANGPKYAYGFRCDRQGRPIPNSRPVRVQLSADGRTLARYRRPGAA